MTKFMFPSILSCHKASLKATRLLNYCSNQTVFNIMNSYFYLVYDPIYYQPNNNLFVVCESLKVLIQCFKAILKRGYSTFQKVFQNSFRNQTKVSSILQFFSSTFKQNSKNTHMLDAHLWVQREPLLML